MLKSRMFAPSVDLAAFATINVAVEIAPLITLRDFGAPVTLVRSPTMMRFRNTGER
jgi:hypothetical protein